jgi:hypothetical protein
LRLLALARRLWQSGSGLRLRLLALARRLPGPALARGWAGRQICPVKTAPVSLYALLFAAATGACQKSDDKQLKALSDRVDKLEAANRKLTEIDQFLRPIMEQQKAEMEAQEANEPDPDTRFAVAIDGNPFQGPAGAAVTIVEAFDFA